MILLNRAVHTVLQLLVPLSIRYPVYSDFLHLLDSVQYILFCKNRPGSNSGKPNFSGLSREHLSAGRGAADAEQ